MNFSKNVFEVFCLLSRNTYFNKHYLVAAPASTEQKHALDKHCIVYKQRHLYHLLKTPNYIALFISPDDYDITVNLKENANVLINAFYFTEAATRICSFQWLWLLTMVNFIIAQPFPKHRFLKNISAWLLLTSKFFFELNSEILLE